MEIKLSDVLIIEMIDKAMDAWCGEGNERLNEVGLKRVAMVTDAEIELYKENLKIRHLDELKSVDVLVSMARKGRK